MDSDFLLSLYATFKEEVDDYFRLLRTELTRLKNADHDDLRLELIQTLYRAAHTIKGAARAVEASDVEQYALAIESAFKPLREVRPVVLTADFYAMVEAQIEVLQGGLEALPSSPEEASLDAAPAAVEAPVPQVSVSSDFETHLQTCYQQMRADFDRALTLTDDKERRAVFGGLVSAAATLGEASIATDDSNLAETSAVLEGFFELLREHPSKNNATTLAEVEQYLQQLGALVGAPGVIAPSTPPPMPTPSQVPAQAPAETRTEQPSVASSEQDEFDRELLELFRSEAESYLTTLGQGIIQLEQAPAAEESRELIANMYRLLHSLKGNARAVGNQPTETLCQAAESLFSALKKGRITLSLPVFDVVHESLSLLETSVSNPHAPSINERVTDLESRMNLLTAGFMQANAPPGASPSPPSGEMPAPTIPPLSEKPTARPPNRPVVERRSDREAGDTLRIVASKLNRLALKIEELLSAKLSVRQRVADLQAIRTLGDSWEREWANAASTMQAVRQLLDAPDTPPALAAQCRQMLDFMLWHQRAAHTLVSRVKGVLADCESDAVSFNNMVTDLQEDSKKLLLAPVSSILGAFPRTVREIARSMGKEVVFTTYGTTVEVDRRVLEGIKDPLLHIIRNSVYHGLETPDVRQQKGKDPTSSIVLSVAQVDANKVEISVADDGAGIDLERVRRVAIERGMAEADVARLSEQEVVSLIFQSDFSTSRSVGDIAGRGLGLAIVREHVQNLGGVVIVEHGAGVGTRFILRLPLSMATSRGVLVQLGDEIYVLPTPSVQRVVRVARADVKVIENRDNIVIQGFPIPLAHLLDILELPRSSSEDPEMFTVVIVQQGDRRIALEVDAVLNEQEVLVKNFPSQLEWIPNVAACTVLGSGELALILRVSDLVDYTFRAGRVEPHEQPLQKVKKSVLVVDDSATSRGLLTQVLEHAGYDVSTAVDGADAFALLLSRRVDIVLSDVEMPRMNGYMLTERVRAEKTLADIPVILLSTLDAEEDKKKGLTAGANAYLAKGGFNQTALLNTIRRLA